MSRAALIAATTAVLALFVFPSTAYADNCGSLSDCYSTAQAALAALVGLSVLFGVLLSLALDLLPGIGTIKGIIEAVTGKDLITGEELAWWERALGFVPVLHGLGKVAAMAGKLDDLADGARAVSRGAPPPLPHSGPPPIPRGGPPPRAPGPYTPPIDNRTAGTGGIERITGGTDVFGARSVTIEGTLQDGIRRTDAPNYNGEGHWRDLRNELGVPNYEAAHLWGPGFGDEAAAGMMLAPPEVNQVWQNQGAERFLRELGNEARAYGGEVRVTATATSHGSDVRGGDALLAEVNYRFSVVDSAGNVVDTKHVSVSVDPPPSGRVHDVEVRDIPPPRR